MKNRASDILLGLVLIAAAVLLAGNAILDWNLTIFFPGWWTLFIIVPAIISIFKSGFGIFNSLCLIIGAMLLGTRLFPEYLSPELFGKLVFPAVLIAIGLNLLFKRPFKKVSKQAEANSRRGRDYTAIFSGIKQFIKDEEFFGAEITAIFGGVDLDLREAVITQDVVINVVSVFGGADIFLPANVRVELSTLPIFGGASEKRAHSKEPGAPTVYISSVCVFGGVDVK